MPADEQVMKQMDEAAAQAKAELLQNAAAWGVGDVAAWWARWYLKAGHKRLGRELVALARKKQA